MKTSLVTGGAGFIGANLVNALLKNNCKVHVLTQKNSNLWRLQNILNQITIHEIDLIDFYAINNLIKNIKPEYIFHLASFGGTPNQKDQNLIFQVNFNGTVNLINACKEVGFECFINTGSSSEYGIKNNPMKENDVLEPVSDYGVSKAAATQFSLKEALFNKLPIYTIRPFSVYGDYEIPGRLITTILVNTILNKPINLSCPHNVRDFIYVEDMVTCYLKIAKQKPTTQHTFNAGTGIQSSIKDVIDTTQNFWHSNLSINWGTTISRPWETQKWQADISKAKTILGWQPTYDLASGLQKSINWFRKNIKYYEQGPCHATTTNKTCRTNTRTN